MDYEILAEFPLEKYKNIYEVSSFGRIWSKQKNRYLKTKQVGEYMTFIVAGPNNINRTLRIDEYVAKAFLGDSDLYLEHIDGDKLNNNLCNLRYIEIPLYLQNKYGSEWKQTNNHQDYFISKQGTVWSLKIENIKTPNKSSPAGYDVMDIGYPNLERFPVHRLVAITFIENTSNLPEVNHKDGDKRNNNFENLEWVTRQENSQHAHDNLPKKPRQKNVKIKEPDNCVELSHIPNYLITRNGDVYSKHIKCYLIPQQTCHGYISFHFVINKKKLNKFAHVLVAESYIPKTCIEQTQVNHKNMIRTDNRVENLEWTTPTENRNHSIVNNPSQFTRNKEVCQIDKDTGEIIAVFGSTREAARKTSATSAGISLVCRGKCNTSGGFKWKFAANKIE